MRKLLLTGLLFGSLLGSNAFAQSDYPTLSQVNQRLQKLSSNASVELKTLTKTAGGKDIQVLKIGTDAKDQKPAIAVVGGVEGFHVLSVELALQFAEKLVAEHDSALETTTFYIFPNMSPDAYEQYHAELKYERRGNAVPADHDRDGTPNDNGYSDLNGDGLITWMRVEDPMGEWTVSKEDERVLVKADRSQGEQQPPEGPEDAAVARGQGRLAVGSHRSHWNAGHGRISPGRDRSGCERQRTIR